MKPGTKPDPTTHPRSPVSAPWLFYFGLLLLTLGIGCRLVQSAADLPGQTVHAVTPGKKEKPKVADPVEVQQILLRFADEYSMRIIVGIDRLQHGDSPADPQEILKWKIALVSSTCSIASGPNPTANMLDMMIFVTVSRMAFEQDWQPRLFGESAQPVLNSCRLAEAEIWGLADKVLTKEQQAELRRGIERWQKEDTNSANVLAARAVGFSTQVASSNKEEENRPGSVFGLLGVDPLAGMDPAVREIAQTRLLAERALFLTQKMPMLVRWQTELFTFNTTQLPAVQQLVSNSTQISTSVERFAAVAEKLPEKISSEREEILKGLEAHEKGLTTLSASLNTTLATFDGVLKRLGVGDTNTPPSPPSTNSEPFRIQDYTATAAQLEATLGKITEVLVTFDRTLGSSNLLQLSEQFGPIVQQAQKTGKEVVNYAFWKGILLVLVALAAALIYRFLSPRLAPGKKNSA